MHMICATNRYYFASARGYPFLLLRGPIYCLSQRAYEAFLRVPSVGRAPQNRNEILE